MHAHKFNFTLSTHMKEICEIKQASKKSITPHLQ